MRLIKLIFSRMHNCMLCAGIVATVLLFGLHVSYASTVTLQLRVGNPLEKAQKKQLRSNLPQRISTNDIIDLGGMELGFDVEKDLYYVFQEIELAPKETRLIEVKLKDIWIISEDAITGLRERADKLTEMLKDRSEHYYDAVALKDAAIKNLDLIFAKQNENTIKPGVKASDHINAFESNLVVFERVTDAVGELENMVLASGQDPGLLVGTSKDIPPPSRDVQVPLDEQKIVIYKIAVQNPSPTMKRDNLSISRDLPLEVRLTDIVEAGGLEVRADANTGAVIVYKNGMELAAGETQTFSVKIRDKWDVNDGRIEKIRQTGSNALEKVTAMDRFESVETLLKNLLSEIDVIAAEPKPVTLNSEYVAFFRDQTKRIDNVEAKINRVNSALKPKRQKMGFDAPPPNPKTTWMIIYIILGFLALVSLVFFFRWLGGGKAEQAQKEGMDQAPPR